MTQALPAGSFAYTLPPRRTSLYARPMSRQGLGVIQDPGGGIVTTGQVRGFITTIDAAIGGLATDIAGTLSALTTTDAGRAFVTSWSAFVAEWHTWRDDHAGTWAALWGSTHDQARAFAARYNGFETQFTALTGRDPSTPAPQQHDAPDANTVGGVSVGVWLGAGTVVLSLGAIAWALNSFARVAAPVARARSRA